jgi:hypothetical protein
MVECSLIMTATMALLIGAVDFGQVLYFHQGLASRLQAGAHWAAVHSYDATKIANVVVYGSETAGQNTQSLMSGLTTAMISSSVSNANTTSAMVEVRIQNFPYRFFSPWIAGAYTARPLKVRVTHEASLP